MYIITVLTTRWHLNAVAAPGFLSPGQRSVVPPLQPATPILSALNKLKNEYQLTLAHCNANARIANFGLWNATPCKVSPRVATLPRPPSCHHWLNANIRYLTLTLNLTLSPTLTLTISPTLILIIIRRNLPNKRSTSAFEFVNALQCTFVHACQFCLNLANSFIIVYHSYEDTCRGRQRIPKKLL